MASRENKSSKFTGVHYYSSRNKFLASFGINGKLKFIGYFKSEILAARAYDEYVIKNNLDRRLNFPDPEPENLIPNTRLIRLTRGKFAIVDEEDFKWLNQWKWVATARSKNTYAVRRSYSNGNTAGFEIKMHKLIINSVDSIVDHVDCNGLNNTRSNLRIVTGQQNNFNCRKMARCYSIYKGVSWHKVRKKFYAYINISRKRTYLGYFDDEIKAADAYNQKAIELFGEFARLNEIKT